MHTPRALKAAGLVLAAVVLGLLTVQGTYALWNSAVNSNAGTVQAADFRVSLTDGPTNTTTDMTVNGLPATVALSTTPIGVVIPGQSVYAGVQLGNVTNAGGDFKIRATAGTPGITDSSGSGFASVLSVKAVAADTLAQCQSAALYAGAKNMASVDIAKNMTGVLCFQVTLDASAPGRLQGKSAGISIPLTVDQL
ncbi:SipW-dependent-type signal peptide-containing protein [Arthrobacter sp. H14-L1]|uniref:SipW-dependent-type signal peptide-containing protein n=1 Tax=Arthrobacter sp. H14-L1 TaxID=2996697 RepID=UPI00226FB6C4|nr:SipW-dependent-type signal peptide-containing protein [Arthrobacter sp. H14-L1]MCY0905694.1 SipW-dependent-type signal peptide-containing protein [Arthrobacter sp. H14-L1]